jgi:hypothetical protein
VIRKDPNFRLWEALTLTSTQRLAGRKVLSTLDMRRSKPHARCYDSEVHTMKDDKV